MKSKRKAEKKGIRKCDEERFRSMVEMTSDWVWEVDKKGVYTYSSPKVKDILGYKPEEVVGKTPFDFMAPDEAKRVNKIFRGIVKSRKPFKTLENINLHKKGQQITLETSGVPVFDAGGKFSGYRGIDRDITDRKETERSLRESEERWRSVVENAPNIIMIVDRSGRIDFINYMVSGIKVKDVVGKKMYDYIEPEYRSLVRRKTARVIKTGKPDKYQIKGIGPRGAPAWYEARISPVRSGTQITGVTLIVTDITDRMDFEKSLRKSEAKYRLIAENTSDFISILTFGGIYVYVSPSHKLLGYKPENLIGRSGLDMIHPDDRMRLVPLLKQYAKVKSNGEKFREYIEFRFPDKKGRWRYMEATANLIEKTSGRGYNILIISRDITGRKEDEKAVKESEEKFRTIFENATDGILLADVENKKFLTGNKTVCRMLGYSLEEIKKLRVEDVHPKESLPHILRLFKDQADEKVSLVENIPVLRKNGSVFYADVNSTPVSFGEKTYLLGIFRDITELKKSENALRKQKDLLDKANEELSWKIQELEAAMSHIKRLEGLVPICVNCKRMRISEADPKDPAAWVPLERYISERTDASFTHGLCPDCIKKMYGDIGKKKEQKGSKK